MKNQNQKYPQSIVKAPENVKWKCHHYLEARRALTQQPQRQWYGTKVVLKL
jgi:hypothetical protein